MKRKTSWLEFLIECGDVEKCSLLSTEKILLMIREKYQEITQTKKDRRLRPDTRKSRLSHLERIKDALIVELCCRTQADVQRKNVTAFLSSLGRQSNVVSFRGPQHM